MRISAFNKKRDGTNLLPDPKYDLERGKLNSGFLGLFRKIWSGDEQRVMIRLVFSAFTDGRIVPLVKPRAGNSPDDKASEKVLKRQLKEWEAKRGASLGRLTKLTKVNGSDPHFLLQLPVLTFSGSAQLQHVLSLFSPTPLPSDAREEIDGIVQNGGKVSAKLVLGNCGLDEKIVTLLKGCLLHANFEVAGGQTLASLVFKIPKESAEYMTSSDWVEIRPIDLYPLLSTWAEVEFEAKKYPKRSKSISKIADTLPQHDPGDVRVDENGVGISPDGTPLYLPKSVDNTKIYESALSQVGQNEDRSFSLGSLDAKVHAGKMAGLPVNTPLLIDWVNFKFTYTNTVGSIHVVALEHYRRCTPVMALNLMRRMTYGKVANMFTTWNLYAPLAGVSTKTEDHLGAQDLNDIKNSEVYQVLRADISNSFDVYHAFTRISRAFADGRISKQYAPTAIDLISGAEAPYRFIASFIRALYNGMIENLSSLYARYSVINVNEALGYLAIFAMYGGFIEQTRARAEQDNKAADNQAVTKGWKPPALPLITREFSEEGKGYQPHQVRVRNLLKDLPDNAVLPVAAGGGKSLLAITDILTAINNGEKGPFLILCPSALVANYVSELVYFTDGLINVIPVTSYNVRTTGYKRYQEILEKAPINTIVVVDFQYALKFRPQATVYGTVKTVVYPVVEMLRLFSPRYVFLDESHKVKNAKSSSYKSVMSLVADIPKKRVASGTLNPDSPSDLPGQIAILDPTVFGTRDEFNERFGADVSGSRVKVWKPGAPQEVINSIKGVAVWAPAARREWACALPPRFDFFLKENFSQNQRVMYNAIFDEMVQTILNDAKKNKKAGALLEKLKGKKGGSSSDADFADMDNSEGEGEGEDDGDDGEDISGAIQPYLAGIEQFATNPAGHPYAKNGFIGADGRRIPPLEGDDLLAPKARALASYMRDEWFPNNDSKVLVFVNYNESVQSIYDQMPKDLQKCGLVYSASQKAEILERFNKDRKIKWMIGIRHSLETGHNLQVAGLLVRLEGVWTPGEQEQGDSRIERPYFGVGGEKRRQVVFLTVVVDKTIDVTKAARLYAKVLANAKFENPTDNRYQDIPDIPVFKMTLDNITTQNDFESNLKDYQYSMGALNQVKKKDYAEYKEKLIAEGGFKFTQIERAENPAGSKILTRVPYAQGTALYSAADLGLVRLDNFLGTEIGADSGEDEEEGDEGEDDENPDATDPRAEAIKEQQKLIDGLRCHTEYGEGVIIRGSAGRSSYITKVMVRFDDGTTAKNLRSTNVFVVTRTDTNSIDMRAAIAKASGLRMTEKITVPGNNLNLKISKKILKDLEERRVAEEKLRKKKVKKVVEVEEKSTGKKVKKVVVVEKPVRKAKEPAKALEVELSLTLMNGYLRLSYSGGDSKVEKALEANNFTLDKPYVSARILNVKHLENQFKEWMNAGFQLSKETDTDALEFLSQEMSSGSFKKHKHFARISKDYDNYLRKNFKPSPDETMLTLFAIISDGGDYDKRIAGKDGNYGAAYLCLPWGSGFPSSKEAVKEKYQRPSTRWKIAPTSFSLYVGSVERVHKVFRELTDAGLKISNIPELNIQAKSVKKVTPKGKGIDLK